MVEMLLRFGAKSHLKDSKAGFDHRSGGWWSDGEVGRCSAGGLGFGRKTHRPAATFGGLKPWDGLVQIHAPFEEVKPGSKRRNGG